MRGNKGNMMNEVMHNKTAKALRNSVKQVVSKAFFVNKKQLEAINSFDQQVDGVHRSSSEKKKLVVILREVPNHLLDERQSSPSHSNK